MPDDSRVQGWRRLAEPLKDVFESDRHFAVAWSTGTVRFFEKVEKPLSERKIEIEDGELIIPVASEMDPDEAPDQFRDRVEVATRLKYGGGGCG